MHPVLSEELARLHRGDLRRAAERHRAVAAVAGCDGPTRSARRAHLLAARLRARLRRTARPAGQAEPCPP
jgi:hypothetical protein